MILATDVHYSGLGSTAVAVAFDDWTSKAPTKTYTSRLSEVAAYCPGKFYQRELPCLIHLLRCNDLSPKIILIDGYVFLDGTSSPGLGKHLYEALDRKAVVVGVAKSSFGGIDKQFQIMRGSSIKPLFVTSAGMEFEQAKIAVANMHGNYRIPTLLQMADQLCRNA